MVKIIEKLILFLNVLMLATCTSGSAQPAIIPEQSFLIQNGQSLIIDGDAGLINLSGSPDEKITVAGTIYNPERSSVQVTEAPEGIRIQVEYRGAQPSKNDPPVELNVSVPQEAQVKVETFAAIVNIRDYHGTVEITSVGGDVHAQNVQGNVSLRSGRGDVFLSDSSGNFRVLGEHGVLSIQSFTGELGVSTIMGTIQFAGKPKSGDSIRLETDHGPVEVQLEPGSDLAVKVNSTSGQIACSPLTLQQSSRSCSGSLGSGTGTLTVRTVSGEVRLEQIP